MELILLNKEFQFVSIIDTFESFIWNDRYNGNGDFEVMIPAFDPAFKKAEHDFYVMIKESDRMMIIESKQITTDFEEGNKAIISGRSLESILKKRIIWSPVVFASGYSLQNAVKKLLDENITNSALDPRRRVTNFKFEASTDPAITALTIDSQSLLGDNLYDIIYGMCESKHIGFKITMNTNHEFVFKLYAGVNRSYDQSVNSWVVFSPKFENIINSNYLESKKNLRDITLVGGIQPEIGSRKMAAAGVNTGGSGLDRRELFTDASGVKDTVDVHHKGRTWNEETEEYDNYDYWSTEVMSTADYTAALVRKGIEELSKLDNRLIKAFEAEVETVHTFKYGEDYFVGDVVQVVNEYGIEAASRIVELVIAEGVSGVTINPTFSVIAPDLVDLSATEL